MGKKSTKILFLTATFVICWQSANSLADINELIQQGDDALKMNNTEFADNAYTRALELDPENFRVLRSLAKIRFNAKKYTEAEKLITRILVLPISVGRSVLVHLKGEAEPLEAELVDETVMMNPMVPKDEPKGVEEKYLKFPLGEKIPHFRLFFKKSGKMKKNRSSLKTPEINDLDHLLSLDIRVYYHLTFGCKVVTFRRRRISGGSPLRIGLSSESFVMTHQSKKDISAASV